MEIIRVVHFYKQNTTIIFYLDESGNLNKHDLEELNEGLTKAQAEAIVNGL